MTPHPTSQRRRARGAILAGLALVIGVLGACRGAAIGEVPRELLDLCTDSLPGGVVAITVNEDGDVIALLADVSIDDLPRGIRNTALSEVEGGRILRARREFTADGERWRVHVAVGDATRVIHIDARSRVIAVEEPVAPGAAPPNVLEAAEHELPGADPLEVFVIRRGKSVEWRVRRTSNALVLEAILAPDGTVRSKTRRTPAEVVVPAQ